MKSNKKRIPRKLKKLNKKQRLSHSFSYKIIEIGKNIREIKHEGPSNIKYFDNKAFDRVLDHQVSRIRTNNKLYLERTFDWGAKSTFCIASSTSLIQFRKNIYHFQNKGLYTGWQYPTNLTKLVCVSENSTNKVLKLRKGTFNEQEYTIISKLEYKHRLPATPVKSLKKGLKIDLAKTGLSTDFKYIFPQQVEVTYRQGGNGKEVTTKIWKKNISTLRERTRMIKSGKGNIKIYEDLTINHNYDKRRVAKRIEPPKPNLEHQEAKVIRKANKVKWSEHQIMLKEHLRCKNRHKSPLKRRRLYNNLSKQEIHSTIIKTVKPITEEIRKHLLNRNIKTKLRLEKKVPKKISTYPRKDLIKLKWEDRELKIKKYIRRELLRTKGYNYFKEKIKNGSKSSQ